jgi:hypothetical protein
MGITEACSPVSRKGSKVGSGQPLSPGARSDPGRVGGPKWDSVPPQPQHRASTHSVPPQPSHVGVTGAKE